MLKNIVIIGSLSFLKCHQMVPVRSDTTNKIALSFVLHANSSNKLVR